MVVELAAGRLISRYLGQSLYTWTSVIGVVLAGISAGNYVGGVLADRYKAGRILPSLFVLSSASCLLVPAVNHAVGLSSALWELSWPLRILIHVTLTFLLPSAMLGTVSPVVAKAALEGGAHPGKTLGAVYAWGAAGSIVGTFVAGFYLIAVMGTVATMVSVSFVLGIMALLYGFQQWLPRLWVLACMAAGLALWGPYGAVAKIGVVVGFREEATPDILFRGDSQYQHITVKTMGSDPNVRGIYLDKMLHSEMDIRDPGNLLYKYAWIYEAVLDKFTPTGQPVRAFVIGGGGYTFPGYLTATRPGSQVDVSEIDPEVTRVAREACGFEPDLGVHAFDMDARNFVSDILRHGVVHTGRYDYVFGDTFNDYSVPYPLTTEEFNRQLSDIMTDQGMYLLNMIDRFDSGRFLGSIILTCRRVFPDVQVFYCHPNLRSRGTYVVVCSKVPRDLSDIAERIRERHDFNGFLLEKVQLDELVSRPGALVLTDDHAPVENLLADVVKQDVPDGLDAKYLREGLAAADAGRLDQAIEKFQQAIRVNPSSKQAYYNLGIALMQRGRGEEALRSYGAALQLDPSSVEVRNNAAVALAQMGRVDDAIGQLSEIIRLKPGNVDAHVNLAILLAQKGQTAVAEKHLAEALNIQPDNATAKEVRQRLGRR